MKFIVAVDRNWAIGKNGGMLYHLPEDLAFFKKTTMGAVVLMGRTTYESLPGGPLPGRINVILTSRRDYPLPEGAVLFQDADAAIDWIQRTHPEKPLFLIGGASLYKDLLDRCESGYVTHIDGSDAEADAWFPDLEQHPEWASARIVYESHSTDPSFYVREYARQQKEKDEGNDG